jgi:predicted aspartyl protease
MSTPFNGREGLIIVRVQVTGPAGSAVLQLALDTGATSTLINTGLLVALGYDPASTSERVEVTTGSGIEFAPRVVLEKILALGASRSSFAVLSHTLPPSAGVDGVLGLDFFRNGHLTIDFRQGTLAFAT